MKIMFLYFLNFHTCGWVSGTGDEWPQRQLKDDTWLSSARTNVRERQQFLTVFIIEALTNFQ